MRISRLLRLVLTGVAIFSCSAQAAYRDPREIHVGILMFDGVQIIDFAAPYEVFGQAGFRISTVSAQGKPVTTAMNLKVSPDLSFAQAASFDVLVVPGGNIHDVVEDQVVRKWLRERSVEADIVLSVCTGSHILATSGLLDNLAATTFHKAFDGLADISPSTKVVRHERWVDNGKIVTSAGLSSGMDAALHVVERLQGRGRARTVAMNLEYDWRWEQGFVRGAMADRYIPKVQIQWPEGSRIDRAEGYGDHNEWFERYLIAGTAAPRDYLQLIKTAYGSAPNWAVAEDNERRVLLIGKSEDGVQTRWEIQTSAATGQGQFEITSRLQVDPKRLPAR